MQKLTFAEFTAHSMNPDADFLEVANVNIGLNYIMANSYHSGTEFYLLIEKHVGFDQIHYGSTIDFGEIMKHERESDQSEYFLITVDPAHEAAALTELRNYLANFLVGFSIRP